MSDQTQICNLALAKYGDKSITDINEGSVLSRACLAIWDTIVDELLAAHPWNFAVDRADLGTPLADTDILGEYSYIYQLPTDCLRVLSLYGSDSNWVREGIKFYCNDQSVKIKYIKRITTTAYYSPIFCNCIATRMAAELGPKFTSDPKISSQFMNELDALMKEAFTLNAYEGRPNLEKNEQALDAGNYSWQKEGR